MNYVKKSIWFTILVLGVGTFILGPLLFNCELMSNDKIPMVYELTVDPPESTNLIDTNPITSSQEDGTTTTVETTTTNTSSSTPSLSSSSEEDSNEPIPGPPSKVSNLMISAYPDGNALFLEWSNPSESDFVGVTLYVSTNTNPISPDEGELILRIAAEDQPNTSYMHGALEDGVRYYYSIFAYDVEGLFSEPATGDAVPHDIQPPDPVTNFSAVPLSYNRVEITWENSSSPDWAGIAIRYRNDDRYPESLTDGNSWENLDGYDSDYIRTDPPQTVSRRSGNQNTQVFLAIWTYDEAGNYSEPVFATSFFKTRDVNKFFATDLDGSIHLYWRYYNDNYVDGAQIYYSAAGFPQTRNPEYPDEDNGVNDPLLLIDQAKPGWESGNYQRGSFTHTDLDNDGDPDNDGNDGNTYYYTLYTYYKNYNAWSDGVTVSIQNKSKTDQLIYLEDFEDEGPNYRGVPNQNIPTSFSGSWQSEDLRGNCASDDDTFWGIVNDPEYAHSGGKSINNTSSAGGDFDPPNYKTYYYRGNNTPTLTFDFDFSGKAYGYVCYWIRSYWNSSYEFWGGVSMNNLWLNNDGNNWLPESGSRNGPYIEQDNWLHMCHDISAWGEQASATLEFTYAGSSNSTSSCGGSKYTAWVFLDDIELVLYNTP
jgi:hypothetical protein